MKSEFDLIESLKKKIPRGLQGAIGIGDDAGLLKTGGTGLLVTADTIADGVDFMASEIKPELAGRKALAVNLSDIAAMGGEPLGFVISLGIPKKFPQKWIVRFYAGLMKLAAEYKTVCLGGDISGAKQFFASVAMLGKAPARPVLRSGARKGDRIGVTGKFGGSIQGRHASFPPRVKEGRWLSAAGVSSMIDVSDGLLQDLGHILKVSKAGAQIDLDRVPVSKAAARPALEHALSDGEDFELLFTVPHKKAAALEKRWKRAFPRVKISWIGQVVSGPGKIEWRRNGRKTAAPRLKRKGFTHF